jgi:hypothetical protein
VSAAGVAPRAEGQRTEPPRRACRLRHGSVLSIRTAKLRDWHPPSEQSNAPGGDVPTSESPKISREAWLLASVLALIALMAAIVLFATWEPALEQEAAKTALSVLAVTVLGGAATVAFEAYRQRREHDAAEQVRTEERRQREIENDRTLAANMRLRQEEAWRREVERLRDARNREDELLRSLLQDTLQAYNRVKRTRRLLKAFTNVANERVVRQDVYDEQIGDLIDEQLVFEEFKRTTSVVGDTRLGLETLRASYEVIEKYLNRVISEYQDSRHVAVARGEVALAELPRLAGFMKTTYAQGDKDLGFEVNVASQLDRIIQRVQTALLEPLHLPEADMLE